jgi:predicted O-linked N-acetylglucosamine transferase (SPINDLY family)
VDLTVDQALQHGVASHKEGKLADAERFYRSILTAVPDHPDANHNLGVLAVSVGKIDLALPLLRLALQKEPSSEQFWHSYIASLVSSGAILRAAYIFLIGERAGVFTQSYEPLAAMIESAQTEGLDESRMNEFMGDRTRILGYNKKIRDLDGVQSAIEETLVAVLKDYRAGFFEAAERLLEALLEILPRHAKAWMLLGVVRKDMTMLAEALAALEKAAMLAPNDYEVICFMAEILKDLGRIDDAKTNYLRAIDIAPGSPAAHNNLGSLYEAVGDFGLAESSYRRAIEVEPHFHQAFNNLGNMFRELHKLSEAEHFLRIAIDLKPDYAPALCGLGNVFSDLNRLPEAEAMHRRSISCQPKYGKALVNLGGVLTRLGRFDEAIEIYRSSITVLPNLPEAHSNLAAVLKDLGRYSEAAESYKTALDLRPGFLVVRDNLLFMLNYDPTINSADLFREYEAYGEVVAGLTKRSFAHDDRPPVEGRRIRVGYSSPDFRGHSCRFFMEPIFRNHNRGQFELFAYSNTSNPDQHTERMKSYFDHWVDVVRMSDEEMAQRVYDDQIDILVDMAGHTAGNRLPVFAMRPAPIQASSSIGFGYTTGLKEVDYFICDENLVPAGSEAYFSEEPLRLPAPCLAYAPPRDVIPDISELPALSKGYVTFGSLTRPVRLNDPLLRVWGEILERVPGSRLRLDQKPFAHEGTREMFWERLEGLGIARDRVDLTCSSPHWDAYRGIDITLDCWPHNAGTTTIDSLWMGVPVLSKLDRASVGRVGAMILKPLGLGDWLVETEEDYVARAVAAASDLDSLTSLRSALRQRIEKSRLVDEVAFVRNLENAYREIAFAEMKAGTMPISREGLHLDTDPLSDADAKAPPKGRPLVKKQKKLTALKKKKIKGWLSSDGGPSGEQIEELLEHYQAGHLSKAEAFAKLLAQEFPRHHYAWMVLGVVITQLKRPEEALDYARRSVELNSESPDAHYNLGNVFWSLGVYEDARASYLEALRLKPDFSDAHNNLGNTLRALGEVYSAEPSYREAIRLDPNNADLQNNFGVLCAELGRPEEAEVCYREAIRLKPDFTSAYSNLGALFVQLERLNDAEEVCRRAIQLGPNDAQGYNNLGDILNALCRHEEAIGFLKKATELDSNYAEAFNNLGIALRRIGELDQAEALFRKAIGLKQNYGSAQCNLGILLREDGQYEQSFQALKESVEYDATCGKSRNNFGLLLADVGRFDDASKNIRQAIRLKPRQIVSYDNLLFVLNYDPTINSADLFREYEAYGEVVAGLTKRSFAHDDRPPVEGRRIRVGYSSPDFRGHSCRFFMEPIFRNHNRGQFELFAYSNTSNPDQHTERMKSYFDHWVDVVRMSDEEMAQRVYDDQIDILVDMAGHTAGNRLPVFAMRPAPIQASSSIGFGYTTGLKEVDYFICDENLVPAGSEAYFSEEPLRLPAPCLAYAPPRDVIPDISELPALSKGYVTFGSLTRPVRLNDPLLRVWGEILERVPGSRLRLDQKPFAHEGTREMFWERLEGLGIARDRVDLTCSSPHWDAYRGIDITLDCWPHNAGTTTIESLWMGVPVLSKLDRVSVGRVGAMILEPLGLGDWLVESEEDYVARAVAAASDLDSLTSLRSALRQRIEKSRLVDEVAFVKNLENTFRKAFAENGGIL